MAVAGLRFAAGTPSGLAMFGAAGERTDWVADPAPLSAAAVAERAGMRVITPPRADEVTVITPPTSRARRD